MSGDIRPTADEVAGLIALRVAEEVGLSAAWEAEATAKFAPLISAALTAAADGAAAGMRERAARHCLASSKAHFDTAHDLAEEIRRLPLPSESPPSRKTETAYRRVGAPSSMAYFNEAQPTPSPTVHEGYALVPRDVLDALGVYLDCFDANGHSPAGDDDWLEVHVGALRKIRSQLSAAPSPNSQGEDVGPSVEAWVDETRAAVNAERDAVVAFCRRREQEALAKRSEYVMASASNPNPSERQLARDRHFSQIAALWRDFANAIRRGEHLPAGETGK